MITVGASEYVYVYKNLKPFFRAVLPPLPVNQIERDIWGQVINFILYSYLAMGLT